MSAATETETALIEIVKLMIGADVVAHPERQPGINAGLEHLRDDFAKKGNKQSAAVVEYIRESSASAESRVAHLNALLDPLRGKRET